MVVSRVLRHGNVITRTRNLVRGGFYSKELNPKPVWLDVVERFPPLERPDIAVRTYRKQVPAIVYPEDRLRQEFYRTYAIKGRALNLFVAEEKSESMKLCDKFIQRQQELIDSGDEEEQAAAQVEHELMAKGVLLTRREQSFVS